MGQAVKAQPVYLDDTGEPVTSAPVYLDDSGNPVGAKAEAKGPIHPYARLGNFIKDHPVGVGSFLGGLAAAPFTAGASLPAAMAIEGAGAVGGTLAGHGAQAAMKGELPSAGELAGDVVLNGVLGSAGPVAGRVIRALPSAVKAAPAFVVDAAAGMIPGGKTAVRVLRGLSTLGEKAAESAPKVNNAGGRLVKSTGKETIEDVMGEGLEATRGAKPKATSLPPPAQLPPGYKPRVSAPTPKAEAPKPAPKAAAPAPKAEPELPASWKQFSQAEAKAPAKVAKAPRPASPEPPPDDPARYAPMWTRPSEVPKENVAASMRSMYGADEAGRRMGLSGDAVREASGRLSKQRPAVANLADMDLAYRRKLMDPKAGVIPPLFISALIQQLLGGEQP